MKILNVVETAFRGTLEEQDDAALWTVQAVRNAGGAEMSVLLRGNAVSYAVAGQDPSGVRIGDLTVEQPRILDDDLRAMKAAGIAIQVVREDALERGIALDRLATDFELVGRDQIADLCAAHDQVWHW